MNEEMPVLVWHDGHLWERRESYWLPICVVCRLALSTADEGQVTCASCRARTPWDWMR